MTYRGLVGGLLLAAMALCAVPAQAQDSPELLAATELFNDKQFEQAAAGFEQVAGSYASRFVASDKQRYYCGSSPGESLIYLTLHAKEEIATEVVSADWCDALYLATYSYVELGQLDKALDAITRAVALAPLKGQYKVERGFVLRGLGRLDDAMASYQEGANGLDVGEDADRWKAASLRGVGWVHAERKQWDAAEKALRKSLELEPDNQMALGELAYIAETRKGK
jgi:tetratricopeptide (TPR) repeat protein